MPNGTAPRDFAPGSTTRAGSVPAGPADPAAPWGVRGQVSDRLRAVAGFVFDLDGTLVLTDPANRSFRPLPGALAMTGWLAGAGVPFVLFTNGTNQPPAGYADALRAAGLDVAQRLVLTPAVSAAELFDRRGYRRVMTLGGDGLAGPLLDAGIEAVPPVRGTRVDAVLAGGFREFTMDALESACDAVWQGAEFYSSSQSVFFATTDGRAIGTSRAIAAMVRSVTGCRVEVVGKPSLHALRTAARRLGLPTSSLAVVGDDPELEVPMAHKGKALAVAVGTGIGTPGAFAGMPPGRGPHLLVPGVDRLLDLCRATPPVPRRPSRRP